MQRSWWALALATAIGAASATAPAHADDGSIIDVLMLYTPESRAEVGDTAAMQAKLNTALAEVNTALQNSSVAFQYRIVHMAEVDYTGGTSPEQVLASLRNTDGVADQILGWRDTYKADIVHMILNNDDLTAGCGSGYMRRPADTDAVAASYAFSITRLGCLSWAGSRFQVGHALAHIFGIQHRYPDDIHYDGRPETSEPLTSYAWGYADPQNRFCDIMASDCPAPGPNATGDYNCPRVQMFSNITATHNGAPVGNASTANGARVMNDYRVIVSNFRNSSTGTPTPTPTPPPGGGIAPTWMNTVEVTATAGNLVRANTAAGWTAGAVSVQTAASGNVAVEFTANETTSYRLLGLSNGDSGPSYTDIDFAIYPAGNGTLYVFEGGSLRGTFGSYASGDRLGVEVVAGEVRYKRNGIVLFTNTGPILNYPLRVDTALYSPGATLANVVVYGMGGGGSNVPPTASAGGSYRWSAGQALTFDGSGSTDSDGSIVSYAWTFGDGSTGSGVSPSHTYSSPGSFTATLTVTDNAGATASASASVTIAPAASTANVTWTSAVGVTASAGSLQKPGAPAWDAGAISTQRINSGDGYVQTTVAETNTYRLFGLSNGNTNQSYEDLDYGLYPASDGKLYIFEQGTYRGLMGSYASGDRLRVSVDGGTVRYLRNGRVLYTSGNAPTYPLLVDTALYSTGATLAGVVITGGAPTPPVANAGGAYKWSAGQAITFDGRGSSDPDGTIVSYAWNFGDGTTGTGATPQKTYSAAGTYSATLTVTDNSGATHSNSAPVTIDARSTAAVSWTSAVGVSAGATITKTSGTTAWDAGAISGQTIASGAGFVQATVNDNTTFRMVGLGNVDSNQSYTDIDFAIYPAGDGGLYVFESGVYKGAFGSYAAGDRLRVAVSSGGMGPMVEYIKNGRVLLMTHPAVTYPLRVDTSFYSNGASFSGVVLTTP